MEDLFADRWTLVTGASSGLGEEFARQLAARRGNLILTARSGDRLEALAGSLAAAHGIATVVIPLDLGAPGGADRLVDELGRRGATVDHLIANAGFGSHGPLVGADPGREGEMVRLNCEALVILTARLLPGIVERRGGVVHVASIAGMQPVPFMATYGATKAFVLSFSEAVAEEVRGTGARVLALCPGPVPTGFQEVAGAGIAPTQRRNILTAAETVRQGLAAYERGTTVCVPGLGNQASLLAARLLPRRLLVRTVGRIMRRKPKDGPTT